MMSKLIVLLVHSFILVLCAYANSDLKSVSLRYYKTSDLTRLPEYFTGKEFSGNTLFIRSKEDRDGLYFSFRIPVALVTSQEKCQVELSILRKGNSENETFSFSLPTNLKDKKEIFLGLTGSDWLLANDKPIAWRLIIKNSLGSTLFLKKSFLWDHE